MRKSKYLTCGRCRKYISLRNDTGWTTFFMTTLCSACYGDMPRDLEHMYCKMYEKYTYELAHKLITDWIQNTRK